MISLLLLSRVAFYILVTFIGIHKGFRWLTITALYLACVAILNFTFLPSREIMGALSFVGALLIFLHARDLKNRRTR